MYTYSTIDFYKRIDTHLPHYLRYPTAPSLFKRAFEHLIMSRAASPKFLCECPVKIFSISNLRLVPRWGIHPLIDQLIIEKQTFLESPLAASSSLSRQEGMKGELKLQYDLNLICLLLKGNNWWIDSCNQVWCFFFLWGMCFPLLNNAVARES